MGSTVVGTVRASHVLNLIQSSKVQISIHLLRWPLSCYSKHPVETASRNIRLECTIQVFPDISGSFDDGDGFYGSMTFSPYTY